MCLRGNRLKFLNFDTFLSLKTVSMLANGADPVEMSHYAVFHLGLHCLPIYRLPESRMKMVKGISILLTQCQMIASGPYGPLIEI